jgi:diguanylate cyclase (GGDEF)-like protein
MTDSNTDIIMGRKTYKGVEDSFRPTIFVCEGHSISEYRLQGLQNLGRPADGVMPEIPAYSRFVSRNHGIFETEGRSSTFTAINTTNGIMFKGAYLKPWTRINLKDGDELTVPSDDHEKDRSVLLVFASTEDRINFWRRLQQASRDKLTGLCDRESFITWWKQNHRNRDYDETVLFILDLDDFKLINDKEGHNTGDAALRMVADILRHSVRYDNQVCRWGGDEFVGIIPVNHSGAKERLAEISQKIWDDSTAAGFPLSVSIGYVDMHSAKNILDIPGIVGMADEALYTAKTNGKGRIEAHK